MWKKNNPFYQELHSCFFNRQDAKLARLFSKVAKNLGVLREVGGCK
jgi:hypothetical protein